MAQQLRQVWALTWRPGDKTGTFLNNMYCRLGMPVSIVQWSQGTATFDAVAFQGYKTIFDPHDASIIFGSGEGCLFAYDLALKPQPANHGFVIGYKSTPELVRLGLEMDTLREQAVQRSFRLQQAPVLPPVYLAFPCPRPPMEDTPALRAAVAHRLDQPVEHVDAMDEADRQVLLENEWNLAWIAPGQRDNHTPHHLISQSFTRRGKLSIGAYEWFGDLVGGELANPLRLLHKPQRKKPIPNPVLVVCRKLRISYRQLMLWIDNQRNPVENYPGDAKLEEILTSVANGMCEAMGDAGKLVTNDAVLDAITHPDKDIIPTASDDLLERVGEAEACRMVRELHETYDTCLADEDIIRALQNPHEPLYARGLARVQLISISAGFQFTAEQLGRERVSADFWSMRPEWES